MCMWRTPAKIFNWSMIMNQLSKYAPLQEHLYNHVYYVAEIFHNSQRVVKHCLKPFCYRKQPRMELFDIDFLAGIKQCNWRDKIPRIQREEYLWETEVNRGRLHSCQIIWFSLFRTRSCVEPIVLTMSKSFFTAVSVIGLCFATWLAAIKSLSSVRDSKSGAVVSQADRLVIRFVLARLCCLQRIL